MILRTEPDQGRLHISKLFRVALPGLHLRAQIPVLPDENTAEFDALAADLEDHFQPANALEWTLLRQLADAEWRMRRVPLIEAGVFARELHAVRDHYEAFPDALRDDPQQVELFLIGAMAGADAPMATSSPGFPATNPASRTAISKPCGA